MDSVPVDVLAGILRDVSGRVLLARRPAGKDHAGLWEFPGGKRDAGETPMAALARELLEELGIEIHDAQPLASITHRYPHKTIRLHAWQIHRWTGEPQALDGQSLAWIPLPELDAWPMPAADRPIVTALRLSSFYAITPEPSGGVDSFCGRFEQLIAGGVRLVQLRSKTLDDASLRPLARRCAFLAERHGADLLLNDRPALAAALSVGLHLPAARLRDWMTGAGHVDDGRAHWLQRDDGIAGVATSPMTVSRQRQARGWLAASCHDRDELALAAALGCDFATVSPVQPTNSHSAALPLGWDRFADLASDSSVPLYALGGLSADDEMTARQHGARGIAAIRALWPS